MLIVALVLAVIGLAALVTAVVTSNELIAWVCIAASAVGVLLLIVDAVRDRSRRDRPEADDSGNETESEVAADADYPDDAAPGEPEAKAVEPPVEESTGEDTEKHDANDR